MRNVPRVMPAIYKRSLKMQLVPKSVQFIFAVRAYDFYMWDYVLHSSY